MFLASVQVIREQLGFDDMPDINAAIEMALNSAEAQIASLLGTQFERTQRIDTFWVRRPGFIDGAHVETQFRLSQGMLAPDPQIVVAAAPSLLPTGRSLSGTRVDLEKGVVTDWQTRFNGEYVEISYTAGFEAEMTSDANPVPTGSYKLDQVPAWLQEAAKLKALCHLANTNAVQEAGVIIDTKVFDNQFTSIINQHQRYTPMAILPL